jgi:pimeloyl-ACP methyl ester carboxylesterase
MARGIRRFAWALVAAPILLSCCALNRAAVVPVPTRAQAHRPDGRAPTLIVFLPGRRSHLGDFEKERFFDMVRERGIDADLVETDLHFGYYAGGTYDERLLEDVIAPARAAGYQRIWLVGISLGGSGAIGFAREHPDAIAGLVLLSPYLGPPEMLETIRAAGGLETWSPDPTAGPGSLKWFIEQNWDSLRRHGATADRPQVLYLGYGRDEPMAPEIGLLAETLPADRVIRVSGGHRWNTWRALWAEILDRLDTGPLR